jgi:hypothetical protein
MSRGKDPYTYMNKTLNLALTLAVVMTLLSVPAFAGVQTVPEPTTLTLLAVGVGATALLRKMKKK